MDDRRNAVGTLQRVLNILDAKERPKYMIKYSIDEVFNIVITATCKIKDIEAPAKGYDLYETQQDAAKEMLFKLIHRGFQLSPLYIMTSSKDLPPNNNSIFNDLNQLCEELALPPAKFKLAFCGGSTEAPVYTVQGMVAEYTSIGVYKTKHEAKQIAAAALYAHFSDAYMVKARLCLGAILSGMFFEKDPMSMKLKLKACEIYITGEVSYEGNVSERVAARRARNRKARRAAQANGD